jgi:hypothetical protein
VASAGVYGAKSWLSVMLLLPLLVGQKMLASFCRLVFGATIYNLWRNCNEIRHGGLPLTDKKLVQKIHWELRTQVAGKGKFHSTAVSW